MKNPKPKPEILNVIPAITDPLGRHWNQPWNIRLALMDETHVLLSAEQVKELCEYSASYPTGAYEGKCWKRKCGTDYLLVWYGPHANPDKLSINYRIILEIE